MRILFIAFLIIAVSCKSPSSPYSNERKEVISFLDNYKRLLQNAKFDSVALLYVDTGFISIGNGNMTIQNNDSIKSKYARFPKVHNDFKWENTRIDVLNENTAVVNSIFYWHDENSADTTKSTYTGVFVKMKNYWKIENEHESIDMSTLIKLIKQSTKTK